MLTVIGGGLAGTEAAWQAARRGVPVRLLEMRPHRGTPAHRSGLLAELVCSNSLKSTGLDKAHGLLKAELHRLGSLVLRCARGARVPAGTALAVDRARFAAAVTEALEGDPLVTIVRQEAVCLPEGGPAIVAAGPLASSSLAAEIARFAGRENLFFYDAIAPVVEAGSIDGTTVFRASRRQEEGEGDYLNCPMTREEYERFIDELLAAEKAPLHGTDRALFFEGCLPIEEMARRGRETLRFGPMRPVGLRSPMTGRRPHAVVQLRQDNLAAEHYSLVGFQTRLLQREQKRVFRMVPGLGAAEFARFGQVHRNSYVNAPALLRPDLSTRRRGDLFFAGQLAGVEGYTESAATGLLAGINAARLLRGMPPVAPPRETMIGALCHYLAESDPRGFQPVNATFGLLPPLPGEPRNKRERRLARARRALVSLGAWIRSCGEDRGAGPADSPEGAGD